MKKLNATFNSVLAVIAFYLLSTVLTKFTLAFTKGVDSNIFIIIVSTMLVVSAILLAYWLKFFETKEWKKEKENFRWSYIWQAVAITFAVIIFSMLMSAIFKPTVVPTTTSTLLRMHFQAIYVAVICAPIAEELVFRGIIYKLFNFKHRDWYVWTSAILFGLSHIEYNQLTSHISLYPMLATTFLGYLLARFYHRQKSLLGSILIHAFYNSFVLALLFFA